jgi:hypothetical protein
MALDVNEWKKAVRAGALKGETVTTFLADVCKYEHAVKFSKVGPASRENLSRLSGSLKSLQIEIKKTRAVCKPRVHDGLAKYLDDMSRDATKLLADTQKQLGEWATFLKSFNTYVGHTRMALEAVIKQPQPATIARNKVPVQGAAKWMAANIPHISMMDDDAFGRRMAAVQSATNVFADLERAQPKSQAGGKPIPATPATLAPHLNRARELLAQLK